MLVWLHRSMRARPLVQGSRPVVCFACTTVQTLTQKTHAGVVAFFFFVEQLP
jgi:hypothetical protein